MLKGISGCAYLKLLAGLFFLFSADSNSQTGCHTNNQGSLSEQIIHCEAALASLESNPAKNLRDWVYLSGLYRSAGDTNQAEKILLAQLESVDSGNELLRYEVIYNLGINAFYGRNFPQSFDYFKQAFHLASQMDKPLELANVYNALANLSQVASDYDSMSVLLQKALVIFVAMEDAKGIAKVQNNLGNAYRYNHKYNLALVSYRQALSLHGNLGQKLQLAHTQLNMARTLVALKQQQKAQSLLKAAIKIFAEKGAIQRIIEANGVLASIALEQKELQLAWDYLAENSNLKAQVDNNYFDPGSELVRVAYYVKTAQVKAAEQLLHRGLSKSGEQKNVLYQERYLKQLAHFYSQQQQDKQANVYWQQYSQQLSQRLAAKQANFGELKEVLKSNKEQGKTLAIAYPTWGLAIVASLLFVVASYRLWLRKKAFDIEQPSSCATPVTHGLTIAEEQKQMVADEVVRRSTLVELMLLSLQLWEQETQKDQLDLAEKSRVWKVSIDDGRLRARAMERYFSMDKLPVNPRWRNVIRTCHFVLAECQNSSPLRDELSVKLHDYLQSIKQQAVH